MTLLRDLVHELTLVPFETLLPPAAILVLYIIGTRLLTSRSAGRTTRVVILIADTITIPALLITLSALIQEISGRAFTPATINRILRALLVLTAVWLFDRYLGLFVWTRRFRRLRGAEAPMIFRNLVSVVMYGVAIALIAVFVFDRTAGGILVSTGVLVGVIGFALQGLLTDLFAGIAMSFDRPFDMGDWVRLPDGTEGEVQQVNWKSTLLKSLNDGIFIVPNSRMSQSIVHNVSRPVRAYAMWMIIAIDRRYPPDYVRKRLLEAALSCSSVLKDPPPTVNLSDGTGNPLRYSVYVYFPSYQEHFAGRSELYLSIYTYLEHAGIETSAEKYEVATEQSPERVIARPTVYDELRQAEIFRILDDEQIQTLAEYSHERTYYPGEVIVRQGDTRADLLIVTSGIVLVRKPKPGGRGVEVARLGAGAILGEMSLLTGAPRSATVSAFVITSVIEVPKDALEPILTDVPELARKFAEVMVERQMTSDQFVEKLRESPKGTPEFIRESIDRFVAGISAFFRLPRRPGSPTGRPPRQGPTQ